MKSFLILIGILFMSACGDSSSPEKVETPALQKIDVVESVHPKTPINPLVGNWIDSQTNTLSFKEDGSALSNSQKMEWKIENDYLVFSFESLEIDICSYTISMEGNLHDPLLVVLNLICAESGKIRYTKTL
jgi:hypothetical protein